MPYVLKPNKLFVKNPEGDGYLPQNIVTDASTADQVSNIEAAGAIQITAIQAKGAETRGSIPDDYTTLSDDVNDLKSAFDNNRRITMDGIALGYYPLYFETVTGGFGGTIGSTYAETTSQTRTRWSDFVPVSLFERIRFELDDYSVYDYYVIGVDDNDSIVYSTSWKHAELAVNSTELSGATKIRMMIRKQTESGYIADESMWLHVIVTFRPAVNANLSYKRVIVSTDDLDTFTNPGIYYYSSPVHPRNEPFETGCILLVYGYSSSTATVQIAIGYGADNDNSHQYAHRELTSNTWSSWRYIKQEWKMFLSGKTFSILGDSISSFTGFVPSGYASHYPAGDVTEYTDTWWGMMITETGIALDINNSYSGSPLCETGTLTERPRGASDERLNNLGTSPDYIIVFMGTNDMNQNATVGSYSVGDSFPVSIDTFRGALAIALKKIANNYPAANVIVCTVPECYPYRLAASATDNPFWTNSQTQTIGNLNKAILEIAPEFGASIADLRHIYNTSSRNNYTHDGGTTEGIGYTFGVHPNKAGMERIKTEILKAMR